MVIDQMREGMIVVDRQRRVTSLNLAAEQILQMPARVAKGKSLRDLLPAADPVGMPEITEEAES